MAIFYGLVLPFFGTLLGAACVFFLRKGIGDSLQKLLLGFASGVMIAASVWSLIIPAIEASSAMARFAFVPAAIGIAAGIGFLFLLDEITPHFHMNAETPEGLPAARLHKTTMMFLAVMLHNIPEGMAVGVVFAGFLTGETNISVANAFALALGIAIQNFPEGAIISMPLLGNGKSKAQSFLFGAASGIVEPLAAFVTILMARLVLPFLPYFLAFAAGAMIYVVVEELIPEASEGKHSNNGTLGFAVGFILMMILDVAL